MGILNLTPDSFADGGRFTRVDAALEHIKTMIDEGADIIDMGGQSTRPGAKAISADEELWRIQAVLTQAVRQFPKQLWSIDTDKAVVAKAAVDAGVQMINDVTALRGDSQMAALVAAVKVPVVLMHAQGRPETMQVAPTYTDVVSEVLADLQERVQYATAKGIATDQLIVDPGIGFGKTAEHNIALLKHLNRFTVLGCPLLIGTSLKSFIGSILQVPLEQRQSGTLASLVWAYAQGARIFRVHHVSQARQALTLTRVIMEAA